MVQQNESIHLRVNILKMKIFQRNAINRPIPTNTYRKKNVKFREMGLGRNSWICQSYYSIKIENITLFLGKIFQFSVLKLFLRLAGTAM